MAKQTYYEILGVDVTADQAEIRRAYRQQTKALNLDMNQVRRQVDSISIAEAQKNPEKYTIENDKEFGQQVYEAVPETVKELAELKFKRLNIIYKTLSDPDRRKAYDQRLGNDYVKAKAKTSQSTKASAPAEKPKPQTPKNTRVKKSRKARPVKTAQEISAEYQGYIRKAVKKLDALRPIYDAALNDIYANAQRNGTKAPDTSKVMQHPDVAAFMVDFRNDKDVHGAISARHSYFKDFQQATAGRANANLLESIFHYLGQLTHNNNTEHNEEMLAIAMSAFYQDLHDQFDRAYAKDAVEFKPVEVKPSEPQPSAIIVSKPHAAPEPEPKPKVDLQAQAAEYMKNQGIIIADSAWKKMTAFEQSLEARNADLQQSIDADKQQLSVIDLAQKIQTQMRTVDSVIHEGLNQLDTLQETEQNNATFYKQFGAQAAALEGALAPIYGKQARGIVEEIARRTAEGYKNPMEILDNKRVLFKKDKLNAAKDMAANFVAFGQNHLAQHNSSDEKQTSRLKDAMRMPFQQNIYAGKFRFALTQYRQDAPDLSQLNVGRTLTNANMALQGLKQDNPTIWKDAYSKLSQPEQEALDAMRIHSQSLPRIFKSDSYQNEVANTDKVMRTQSNRYQQQIADNRVEQGAVQQSLASFQNGFMKIADDITQKLRNQTFASSGMAQHWVQSLSARVDRLIAKNTPDLTNFHVGFQYQAAQSARASK